VRGGHGRRLHRAHGAPAFGASALVAWRKRVWRRPDPGCPVITFCEAHPLIGTRTELTTRAIGWTTDALALDDTTVSALARHRGMERHICWDAIEAEAERRMADPERLTGVVTLGIVSTSGSPRTTAGFSTVMPATVPDGCASALLARGLPVQPGHA
jgi:transposase